MQHILVWTFSLHINGAGCEQDLEARQMYEPVTNRDVLSEANARQFRVDGTPY